MSLKLNIVISIAIFSCFSTVKSATIPDLAGTNNLEGSSLYNTICVQDSILFSAFNSRDFDQFKEFFSNNLEVYQDNIGVRDYNQSMEAFQGLFQGNLIITRQLLKETLEVYPIKDYGAIEIGQHTFCHVENGKLDCGTYKFVHIWENQNGKWKITRIITYNH